MNSEKIQKLVLAALFAALSCVATLVISIPMPVTNGYINLGDGAVLLGAFLLGPVWGAAAGGLGSMLADLILGYAVYAPGTLLIKGLMALCAALVLRSLANRPLVGSLAGGLLGELVMVLGYFAYESTLLGYGLAAAASIPGNCLQGAAGLIASVAVFQALNAIPAVRRLRD